MTEKIELREFQRQTRMLAAREARVAFVGGAALGIALVGLMTWLAGDAPPWYFSLGMPIGLGLLVAALRHRQILN